MPCILIRSSMMWFVRSWLFTSLLMQLKNMKRQNEWRKKRVLEIMLPTKNRFFCILFLFSWPVLFHPKWQATRVRQKLEEAQKKKQFSSALRQKDWQHQRKFLLQQYHYFHKHYRDIILPRFATASTANALMVTVRWVHFFLTEYFLFRFNF